VHGEWLHIHPFHTILVRLLLAGWRTAEDQHDLHTIRRGLRGSRVQDIHAGGWGLPGDEQGLGRMQLLYEVAVD
jgi:hypothetical protein